MNKAEYKKIREGPNPLYEYYIEAGGLLKQPPEFKKWIQIWMMTQGVDYNTGTLIILEYLDKKHGYKQK